MKVLLRFILFTAYILVMILSLFGIPLLIIHLFTMWAAGAGRGENAEKMVEKSLVDGEKILCTAIGKRLFSLFFRRPVIAMTNNRILFFCRPLLGGFNMVDLQWKDIGDASLSQNIIPGLAGSKLIFSHIKLPEYIYIDINCDKASEIYKYSQREEQAWKEKHRVRKMEEERASAGGIYISTGSDNGPETSDMNQVLDKIKQAKDMLDQGIINDVEFNEIKAKILNRC